MNILAPEEPLLNKNFEIKKSELDKIFEIKTKAPINEESLKKYLT